MKTATARSWRCRHGIHCWTTIPRSTLCAAQRAGLTHPDWYIGPRVPPYCERCDEDRHPRPPLFPLPPG